MRHSLIRQTGVGRAASASHREGFPYPPSVQSDLFNYLSPEQRELVKPVLRILKRACQEELCLALLDYMESGAAAVPSELMLGSLFFYLTGDGTPRQGERKGLIRPLRDTGQHVQ